MPIRRKTLSNQSVDQFKIMGPDSTGMEHKGISRQPDLDWEMRNGSREDMVDRKRLQKSDRRIDIQKTPQYTLSLDLYYTKRV